MILTDALAKTSMIFGNAMIMREIEVENKWDCVFGGRGCASRAFGQAKALVTSQNGTSRELGGAKGISERRAGANAQTSAVRELLNSSVGTHGQTKRIFRAEASDSSSQ